MKKESHKTPKNWQERLDKIRTQNTDFENKLMVWLYDTNTNGDAIYDIQEDISNSFNSTTEPCEIAVMDRCESIFYLAVALNWAFMKDIKEPITAYALLCKEHPVDNDEFDEILDKLQRWERKDEKGEKHILVLN